MALQEGTPRRRTGVGSVRQCGNGSAEEGRRLADVYMGQSLAEEGKGRDTTGQPVSRFQIKLCFKGLS